MARIDVFRVVTSALACPILCIPAVLDLAGADVPEIFADAVVVGGVETLGVEGARRLISVYGTCAGWVRGVEAGGLKPARRRVTSFTLASIVQLISARSSQPAGRDAVQFIACADWVVRIVATRVERARTQVVCITAVTDGARRVGTRMANEALILGHAGHLGFTI